ncbi:MAG: AhpC/TSA family protein [Planctomycetes bacterium]|nr:AhpC/TSA family protein [Planctomycetota bacterium]
MNADSMTNQAALASARTTAGETVLEMSRRGRVMLVFLRHTGCPFCREAMADIQRRRAEIERSARVVFVHQAPEDEANRAFFDAAGVGDIPRVSDPERALYRAAGLKRGSLWAIFGPYIWFRSIQAMLTGRRLGRMIGDVFQMPGVLVIEDGAVVGEYRHRSQADRPDYVSVACPVR